VGAEMFPESDIQCGNSAGSLRRKRPATGRLSAAHIFTPLARQ
jgi:hypothetical protein